jgi:hypothetical protein
MRQLREIAWLLYLRALTALASEGKAAAAEATALGGLRMTKTVPEISNLM